MVGMAIDGKYGRVTLEHGTIGEDEPVVVFRAQDRLMVPLLRQYEMLCSVTGSPQRHLDMITKRIGDVRAWQENHPTKQPDSESSRAWMKE